MPKICYVPKTFGAEHQAIIEQADAIATEYAAQGFDLTLRQIYYQFVARDLLPNTIQSYKRLGGILNDARLAGLLDWDHMVDRTRNVEIPSTWDSPSSIIEAAAQSYAIDLWADQPRRVEVWVEKDALVGVIGPTCRKWQVPHFACRGYASQSEMWRAAGRFARWQRRGQLPVVLHLGDHDPSGIDMTRDNRDRLAMLRGASEVRRLALNMDQIEQYNPPPNPAKTTDSRAAEYIAEHGGESWELDALEPSVLADLIETEILGVLDQERFDARREIQESQRERLEQLAADADL